MTRLQQADVLLGEAGLWYIHGSFALVIQNPNGQRFNDRMEVAMHLRMYNKLLNECCKSAVI